MRYERYTQPATFDAETETPFIEFEIGECGNAALKPH